jgi:DNA-binding Lrp family transcriptional regulator
VTTLEALDEVDRRIVAALQLNGRASWREIAAVACTSENTVARRAGRLLEAGIVHVAVVRDPRCAGRGHVANVFIRCRNGTQFGVAQALLARPDVWSLSVVTGPRDLFCQVTVGTAEDLARVLLSDFQHIDGIESTVAETVLRTFKLSYDWARELLEPGADQIASPPSLHDEQPHKLGLADTAIVAALSADARRPFSAVAEETGINERTVRRRFEALRHRGCVNVATFVPGQALGFQPEMLLRIDVSPAHLHQAASRLARHRGVRYLAVTLGQVGLFGEVYLPSLDAVYRFTTDDIGSLPGITGMEFITELLTLKRGYVPLPASATLHGAWTPSDPSSSANCPRLRRLRQSPAKAGKAVAQRYVMRDRAALPHSRPITHWNCQPGTTLRSPSHRHGA